MQYTIHHANKDFKVNTDHAVDITLGINKSENVNCYYLSGPSFSYFESEAFSGNLSKGGSVNCEQMTFYAHASGTHTECALHVADVDFDMRHLDFAPLQIGVLISVSPSPIGPDKVIDLSSLKGLNNPYDAKVLMVRTLPNLESKAVANYSGTNPVYFEPDVLLFIKSLGFEHLICDIPSIDKESDEGKLLAHKHWFLDNGKATVKRSITELAYMPDRLSDGLHAVQMQVPKIQSDAVPSRIIVYPCA